MAEPTTTATAIAALAGSVTAALKLLSRRSNLAAWVRRRQDEDRARDEALVELMELVAKRAGVDDTEISAVRARLERRIEEIAGTDYRRKPRLPRLLKRTRRKEANS